MNISKKGIYISVFSILLMGLLMSSCVYDKAELETSDNIINPNEYSLALTIDLPVMNTRSEEADYWEKYEDYVGDFSLQFFKASEQGEKLSPEAQKLIKKYNSSELSFFEVEEGTNGYMKKWYVRIPMGDDDASFINQLREEDFKIAVLANWPNDGIQGIEVEDDINTLHHLVEDKIYKDNEVYGFLTDSEGKMGATTDWVNANDETDAIPTGKTPNIQPIPMYGVQKYGKLGDVWVEGTVFDLSNFNKLSPTAPHYEVHPIQLLRSVAKVELFLPEDFNRVFLCNMNRTAYSEPMDVVSNTADIWKDDKTASDHWLDDDCEWSKLIGLEPFYVYSTIEAYQQKLSWYYGNWNKYKDSGSPDTSNKFGTDYPHILNPHINRCDLVKFKEAETNDDGLKRYVLYVPEKFVDDPDFTDIDEGINAAAPKVCHIRFLAKDDPDEILYDNNNWYRIYFTKEGFYSKNGADPPILEDDNHLWENTYENDLEILQQHWTIMRNHVYTFTVKYNPGGKLAVQVKVLPWKRRMIEVEW